MIGDEQEVTDSNRANWEFEYKASELAEAAESQRRFRVSRVEAWEAKKSEVMAKIKETGLSVHEGIAASMSNYTNMDNGARVMVDSTLQSDLNECVRKIRKHRGLAAQYASWSAVLNANPRSLLKLKLSDWMFFFGKE